MQKLFNADLLDIMPVERGFVYACKETTPKLETAVAFYKYNQEIDIFERIPVLSYIEEKYGESSARLAKNLGDFVTCSFVSLTKATRAAAYPDGSLKIIDASGEIISEISVKYLDNPARSPAPNGNDLWFAVPDANAIINYSVKHDRVEFRAGGLKEKAFCHPVDVRVYEDKLFVCNAYSYKIRTLGLKNYNVADYCVFNEPVYGYFRVKDVEYAVMRSGVYSL